MPLDDERPLLDRLRRGDGDAFEELVRTHSPRLLAMARRMLGSEDEARDAVQEGMLSVFRAIDRFSGESSLGTWVYRIVTNAALMRLRTRGRRGEQSIDELLPSFLDDGHAAEPAAEWCDPADVALARHELRSVVRQAIARLPETHRTVLELRDIEELDTEEVATILGVSTNCVKVRLHRARQALRTLLAPQFELPAAPAAPAARRGRTADRREHLPEPTATARASDHAHLAE